MNNIKMLVTPEQSIKVQKICFNLGIFWSMNQNELMETKHKALFIEDRTLYYSNINFEGYTNFKTVNADNFIKTKGFTIKKLLRRK